MPDFSKIWATNSPLPAYTFSDADYLMGWDFVAAAPPTKNQFDAWFKATDEKLKYLYDQLQNTASKLYPVGSVYISFNNVDPSTLFGGTWVRLKDRFLLASGDSYAPNTTGGSPTKTIGVSNMPSHNHSVSSSGSHSHSVTTAGAGGHTHTATSNTTGNHEHAKGSMNITGTFRGVDKSMSGAFSRLAQEDGYLHFGGGQYTDVANVDFNASRTWTGSTSTAGNHSHEITVKSVGSHTHTVTITNTGNHTHTTNNTGGSVPLNIMPPYTTVYMFRRTA